MQLNNLDLNKLHTFAAVVEHGGVGGAAAQLGRTPSAVSQSVSGARGGARRQALRPGRQAAGADARRAAAVRARCASITAALQRTVDALVNADRRGARPGARRRLPRLPAPAPGGVSRPAFAPAIRSVQLRVVYAPQEDLNARLLRNRLDFAFALRPRPEGHAQLQSTQLFEEALVLVGEPALLPPRLQPRGARRARRSSTTTRAIR